MNENARKWVEALRSGEFEQARCVLREKDRFCCLGVACELYRRETGQGEWDDESHFLGDAHTLPYTVRDWLGLRSEVGGYSAVTPSGEKNLADDHNDKGETFAQIADLIESEPEGLFV